MVSPGKIYLIATPIGNLSDISKRAIDTLSKCDVVACEDTRVTGKLLRTLGINARLERLDENTIRTKSEMIVKRVLDGENVVFCSDAGMPCISDPGAFLVSTAHEMGACVTIIPGPSACESAFSLSGFESTEYYFKGFLPKKKSELITCINKLLTLKVPSVVYESPNRILHTLSAVDSLNPKREVFCVKEISKIHETYYKGTSSEVKCAIEEAGAPALKGEWVIVINGLSKDETSSAEDGVMMRAKQYATDKRAAGICSTDIKNDLIKYFNVTKNTAFELATFS